MTSAVT